MNLTSQKSAKPQTAGKSKSSVRWLLIGAIPILIGIAICVFFALKTEAQKGFLGTRMFPLKPAFDFTLTGTDSQEVRLDQFHGKIVLFIFGFTHCANICPTSLTNLAAVYQALTPKEQKQVQIIFVSVDPDRDKPKTLAGYVTAFDPNFIGLCGPKPVMDEVVQAYGATYEMVPGPTNLPNDYYVNHSAYAYLINPSGMWELLYDNDKLADVQQMVSDIRKVLRESSLH